MPEQRRIQEPPIRITPASRATAQRIAKVTGLSYIQVIEQAVKAAGQHFDHHGGRLLLPLRFNEIFRVATLPDPDTMILDVTGHVEPKSTDVAGTGKSGKQAHKAVPKG